MSQLPSLICGLCVGRPHSLVVLESHSSGLNDKVIEFGQHSAERFEQRQQNESNKAHLAARPAHFVRVHERRHREALLLLGRTLREELLQEAVQPGFGHVQGPRLVGDVGHLDEYHAHEVRVRLVRVVEGGRYLLELRDYLVMPRHVGGQNAPDDSLPHFPGDGERERRVSVPLDVLNC